MPPKSKFSQKKNTQTLDTLKQQLRDKLIQVGMNLEGQEQVKTKRSKNTRGKTEQDESLPILSSMKSNKFYVNDFKDIFARKIEEMAIHRYEPKNISKEVIKGIKYDYSVNSSRNVSPTAIKEALRRKLMEQEAKKLKSEEKLPMLKEPRSRSGKKQWSETIRITRIDRPFLLEDQIQKDKFIRPRRSKTEGRQFIRQKASCRKKIKNSIGKQITPWQGNFARDTLQFFH